MNHIEHAFYINLDSRPDRRQYMEEHLKTVGIHAERFKAVKLTNGALGCSMSHLKLLETAKSNNWDSILIMEDDIQFVNPCKFIQQLNGFLQVHKEFDVLLIAGNNMPPFSKIDDTCVKVTRCQTTTGYVVKNHYFNTIIQNVRDGIKNLMKTPEKHDLYAIDKYWFRLQERGNWYLIVPLTVTQREDYSDIEKRITNYSRVMLDLDKEAFLRAQKTAFLKAQSAPSMKLF
jgi:glycosyl transferase family 25